MEELVKFIISIFLFELVFSLVFKYFRLDLYTKIYIRKIKLYWKNLSKRKKIFFISFGLVFILIGIIIVLRSPFLIKKSVILFKKQLAKLFILKPKNLIVSLFFK